MASSTRSAAQRRRSLAMARQTTYTRNPAPVDDAGDEVEDEEWDEADTTPRWPAIAGLVICILGLADSAYLTYAHYTSAANLACSTKGFVDCAAVTTSKYSHVFGLPVSVLGLAFFAFMLPLMLPAAWRSRNRLLRLARLGAVVVGMGMVLWLVYVELVKLDNLCEYCTGVHILTFGLLLVVAFGTIATAAEVD
jgi:uncharacterized membrane protein